MNNMELWIRSQGRKKLIKVVNIELADHYSYIDVVENYMPANATKYEDMKTRKVQKKDKYIKTVFLCNDEIILGEYSTKERALEVLDEIQNILKPLIFIKQGNEEHTLLGARQAGITSTLETEFKELPTYVYEMPKE